MKQNNSSSPEYLTINEFGDTWRVSRSTVYRWIAEGLVHTIPIGERGQRIPRDEVDAVAERLEATRR